MGTFSHISASSSPYAASSADPRRPGASIGASARSYFASDARRALTSALGLVWLLDGLLQLQPHMYSGGFVKLLGEGAQGEPQWLGSSITWSVHVFQQDQALWNTLFALIQILIGIGLLYRPTVKPALAISIVWALAVWWVGEAFGFLLMEMTSASPLTGAPGAAVLYVLLAAIVWPARRPGGLLGVRGAKAAWAALWLLMAALWLQFQNSTPSVIAARIRLEAPSGISWLTSLQHSAAGVVSGNGVWIALLLALLSAAIGIAVAAGWHPKPFLLLAILLSLLYWIVGQGFGGIFTGEGTDPNSGLMFILLALAMYALIPRHGEEAVGVGSSAAAVRLSASPDR